MIARPAAPSARSSACCASLPCAALAGREALSPGKRRMPFRAAKGAAPPVQPGVALSRPIGRPLPPGRAAPSPIGRGFARRAGPASVDPGLTGALPQAGHKRRAVALRRANPARRPGPRDFRDLVFLRTRRERRAENQPRACHRARFVTNLRAAPAEPPPARAVSTAVQHRALPLDRHRRGLRRPDPVQLRPMRPPPRAAHRFTYQLGSCSSSERRSRSTSSTRSFCVCTSSLA